MIAHFNMMDSLKPKGKCMYKWCCYASYQADTNLSVVKFSRSIEAGMLQRVVEYFFAQKVRKLVGKPLLSRIHMALNRTSLLMNNSN